MTENKTKVNELEVTDFLNGVTDEKRRKDAFTVMALMKALTGKEPKMWGSSLIGFDSYHYRYESGREGDFFRTGLSPRKTALTVYIMPGFEPFQELMDKLGKYKTGKSCLYIKKLEDVDMEVLKALIRASLVLMEERYG